MSIDNRFNITQRSLALVNDNFDASDRIRLLNALNNGQIDRDFLDGLLDRYEDGNSETRSTIGYQLENILPFAESRVMTTQELERIFNNGGIAALNNAVENPGDLARVISFDDGESSYTADEWASIYQRVFGSNRFTMTELRDQVYFYSSEEFTDAEKRILNEIKTNSNLQNLLKLINQDDPSNELRIMTGNILNVGVLGTNVVVNNQALITIDLSTQDFELALLNEISEAYAGFLDDSALLLRLRRSFQTYSASIDVLFQSANLTAEQLNKVNSQYMPYYSDNLEFTSQEEAEAGIELLLRSKPYFDSETAGIELIAVRVSDTEWTIQARESKPTLQEPVIIQPPKPAVQQTEEVPPTQTDEPYFPPIVNVEVQTNPSEEPIRNLRVNVPSYGNFDLQVLDGNVFSSQQNELTDSIIQFFNAPENLKTFFTDQELNLMRQGNVIDMGNNQNFKTTNEVQISFGGKPLNLRITRTSLNYQG